jgi:Glycosyl hydrolase family 10
MGIMNFQLPANLPADAVQELCRASIAGGQDTMPYLSVVEVKDGVMTVRRQLDESGFLLAPWPVDGAGHLMVSSATLMERTEPYQLPLELARGKVNQVRGQASDWIIGGLVMPDELAERIHQASLSFSRAVVGGSAPGEGQQALVHGWQAAEHLVRAYMNQVFQIRHSRQATLDTLLGCRLASVPAAQQSQALRDACNSVSICFPWNLIEPGESDYRWEPYDALVDWAIAQGLQVIGGPLVDFSGAQLPDWLWQRERDLGSLSVFLCDFVELTMRRYKARIKTWQVAAAANATRALAMSDEELLWLTVRLVEAARNVDPALELILGVAQPWGDYMAGQEHTHSPFVFADTVIRTGLKLQALEIELAMGVWPRGSYCRDMLDASRILDLYALLGVPLQVTLAYPSAATADERADPDLLVDGGRWRGPVNPETQADWAATFAELAVCKPYVRSVQWTHFTDGEPHLLPHCGLIDGQGNVKPALARLRQLRERHLK